MIATTAACENKKISTIPACDDSKIPFPQTNKSITIVIGIDSHIQFRLEILASIKLLESKT
jgi:hypothetical protein